MTTPRHICCVLVDRANYGRLKPVMQAVHSHPDLQLSVVCAGTMVLERFGQPVNVVREDGFPVVGEVFMELEGSTPSTMAKSVGFGIVEFSGEFARIKPDMVLMIGDRYEALAAMVASAFMNIPVVHMQGGEVSGSIDESTRHAMTKYAHFHFPATKRSAEFVMRMGESAKHILGVGCPSSDIAKNLDRNIPPDLFNRRGSGAEIDPSKPYFLVVFHPTTTEFGDERDQMRELLHALAVHKTPTVLLWPNIDAGADYISKAIRVFRDQEDNPWLRAVTNFSPEDYMRVLANASCAIGNSSSFVRDSSFFGTPVVLVGNRQAGRETAENVKKVDAVTKDIDAAIKSQIDHGRYKPSTLYGDGSVSETLANAIATVEIYVQKRLSYLDEL